MSGADDVTTNGLRRCTLRAIGSMTIFAQTAAVTATVTPRRASCTPCPGDDTHRTTRMSAISPKKSRGPRRAKNAANRSNCARRRCSVHNHATIRPSQRLIALNQPLSRLCHGSATETPGSFTLSILKISSASRQYPWGHGIPPSSAGDAASFHPAEGGAPALPRAIWTVASCSIDCANGHASPSSTSPS